MAIWLFAAGFKETVVVDLFFFSKFFFLFIVAYIKNRSKWQAADTFFSTSGSRYKGKASVYWRSRSLKLIIEYVYVIIKYQVN